MGKISLLFASVAVCICHGPVTPAAWLSLLAGVFPCLAALVGRGTQGLLPLELMWRVKNHSTKPASLTTEQQDSFGEQSLLVLSMGSPQDLQCSLVSQHQQSQKLNCPLWLGHP